MYLFLLSAKASLAQELTKKTVWSLSPDRGSGRGSQGLGFRQEEKSEKHAPGRTWRQIRAHPLGGGMAQVVPPGRGNAKVRGLLGWA